MFKLHWSKGCGSFAPHAALNEAGANYELIEIDLDANEHLTPAFLSINPRAQVPVLTLPDGTVMTESVAMMMHIADCHPESALLPALGDSQRAVCYRWLVFSAVNLYESGCRIADTHHYSTKEQDYDGIREKARIDLDNYWSMVAEAVGKGPFLLGSQFSLVDICLLMIAQWHPDPPTLYKSHPNLQVLCESTKGRRAIDTIWAMNFGT